MPGMAVDQAPGIAGETALGVEQAPDVAPRQMRLQPSQRIGVEDVEPDALPGHERAAERPAGTPRLALVDPDPPDRPYDVRDPRELDQLTMRVVRGCEDRRQRRRAFLDGARPRGQQEPHQPWHEPRQIAPADAHRAPGIQQHRRYLSQYV